MAVPFEPSLWTMLATYTDLWQPNSASGSSDVLTEDDKMLWGATESQTNKNIQVLQHIFGERKFC